MNYIDSSNVFKVDNIININHLYHLHQYIKKYGYIDYNNIIYFENYLINLNINNKEITETINKIRVHFK